MGGGAEVVVMAVVVVEVVVLAVVIFRGPLVVVGSSPVLEQNKSHEMRSGEHEITHGTLES